MLISRSSLKDYVVDVGFLYLTSVTPAVVRCTPDSRKSLSYEILDKFRQGFTCDFELCFSRIPKLYRVSVSSLPNVVSKLTHRKLTDRLKSVIPVVSENFVR